MKYIFDHEEIYPALLKNIEVVLSGEEDSEDEDSNVVFTFIVWNGSVFKEFTHTCKNIFSDGQYDFREYCLSFIKSYKYDYDDELYEEILNEMDMNKWIGCFFEVGAIEYRRGINKFSSCRVYGDYIYYIEYDDEDEEEFIQYEKEKKDTAESYRKIFEKYKPDIDVLKETPVPKELNKYMRETINRTDLVSEKYKDVPPYSPERYNIDC